MSAILGFSSNEGGPSDQQSQFRRTAHRTDPARRHSRRHHRRAYRRECVLRPRRADLPTSIPRLSSRWHASADSGFDDQKSNIVQTVASAAGTLSGTFRAPGLVMIGCGSFPLDLLRSPSANLERCIRFHCARSGHGFDRHTWKAGLRRSAGRQPGRRRTASAPKKAAPARCALGRSAYRCCAGRGHARLR